MESKMKRVLCGSVSPIPRDAADAIDVVSVRLMASSNGPRVIAVQ
ncbi:hypothetical protein SDC9_164458 [bioreactor metagenome]|uniref:Uncharacterized protein n=1 Tax=bioreactor metagenome TaxID=1076179 RepID=A0A645FRM9_9ZZZZ